jgi:DNA primase catalytic subunit
MINSKNELLLNFFTLTKNIQEWSEVSLNDIKLLLSQHINSEILKIDQNSWDIEFKSVNNPTYFKEIQTIDPNIKIEKSRRGELIALEKRNTVSKWIIIFLFIFLIITIFYFFNLKNLDLSLYMYNTNIRT